ncbi:MAG TPA: phosphatidylglycerol lysyltransferase domain-containing protein [Candidatus Saccharimonadales bacterium]|nr:phosphatidylglycerol lysyltransferase domain-containing protein [Candidatus Saccharimonadales bacterium]
MSQTTTHSNLVLRVVIWGVAVNGLLLIAFTLFDLDVLHIHGHLRGQLHYNGLTTGLPLIEGLTLIYLSSLLARRKETAWAVTVGVYTFLLGVNFLQLLLIDADRGLLRTRLLRGIIFPLVVAGGLLYYRHEFTVKSDLQSFRQTLPIIVTILIVTFLYGTVGFLLMDVHDFHQTISVGGAMHHTIDQFGLTTNQPLVAYSHRARIFIDSLSVISVGALVYVLVSLFQPLKARFIDQSQNRELMRDLLEQYPADSDDFFKLWPHDKLYYVSEDHRTAVALNVQRGIALTVGDPAGDSQRYGHLLREFGQLCRSNDWQPAFIHIQEKYRPIYEQQGFVLQKIGEEGVLDIAHFQRNVVTNKYFRHIQNKFTKQGYTSELLQPPHHDAIINRLNKISQDWLTQPGRAERGLLMGQFSSLYMQMCNLMVVRDKEGMIQAFINQVPSFDPEMSNYDLLRHTSDSPGNINDFLLINFIDFLSTQESKRLNLGLCPLSGLSKDEANHSVIDSALRFVYANGDRLYSFSGLRRFKSKYEPQWTPRYIAYKGGIRGFTRTLNALNRAMKAKPHHLTR